MDLLQTIVLALIQGLTEFLLISSSAHLILPAQLLGWQDQGLVFDVAVHVGTLTAVVFYFRREVWSMAVSWTTSCLNPHRSPDDDARLAWMVILASLPVIGVGLIFDEQIETHLRSTMVIASTTVFFALLLAWAELKSRNLDASVKIGFGIALFIGLAQCFALIPGTSRSGVTITMAVLLGMGRVEAARFSFLMVVPLIFGKIAKDVLGGDISFESSQIIPMGAGFFAAFISGLVACQWMIALVKKSKLSYFSIYCAIVGIIAITYSFFN